MAKSKNSPGSHVQNVPILKLEEFERKLVTDAETNNITNDGTPFKLNLSQSVNGLQDEILPLRLKFSEFLSMMANLDQEDGTSKLTPQEHYARVKTHLVSLYDSIQKLSKDFQSLEELFGCIAEYSTVNQSKEFEPLESLSIPYSSIVAASTANTTVNAVPPNNSNSGTPNNINNINATPVAAAAATTITHQRKNTSNVNNKPSPQGNTPATGITMAAPTPTPTTTGTLNNNTTSTTTVKKPRKPRQPRKSLSQTSTPASTNISINSNTGGINPNNVTNSIQSPVVQTPLMSSNVGTPLQAMNMGQGTMNPSSILGMTPNNGNTNNSNNNNNNNNNANSNNPMGNGSNSNPILSPANVLNNAILNTNNGGNNGNNNNISNNMGTMSMNTPNVSLGAPSLSNQNSLTPANILSMSNANMGNMNNRGNNNSNSNNDQGNNNADLGNMDLTSLDLSSLNMDFI